MFLKDMLSGLTAKDGYVKTLNLFYWDIGIVTPLLIVIFLLFEWIGRENKYAIEKTFANKKIIPQKHFSIFNFNFDFSVYEQEGNTFIYFQFLENEKNFYPNYLYL